MQLLALLPCSFAMLCCMSKKPASSPLSSSRPAVAAEGDAHRLAPRAAHQRVIVAQPPEEDGSRKAGHQPPEVRGAAPWARKHLVNPRGVLQSIAIHEGVVPFSMVGPIQQRPRRQISFSRKQLLVLRLRLQMLPRPPTRLSRLPIACSLHLR